MRHIAEVGFPFVSMALAALGWLSGCSGERTNLMLTEVSGDIGETLTDIDKEREDAASGDDHQEVADAPLTASSYCEATVGMFCEYYLRCGRMAVGSFEACERTFLEACNARYEPLYADLEARGLLTLSRDGLERCGEHLSRVTCEDQLFDLDGCRDLWMGKAPEGGPCGPGIESFICGEDATCVLDTSFCGTCVPLAGDAACDFEHRCLETATCRDGACVERARVGEACDDDHPCVLGARCEGVCKAPEIVGPREACDQVKRCQYKAACVAGRCVELALLGEDCGDEVGCASGFCDDGRCAPLRSADGSCDSGAQCQSGRCDAGRCTAIGWSCQPE